MVVRIEITVWIVRDSMIWMAFWLCRVPFLAALTVAVLSNQMWLSMKNTLDMEVFQQAAQPIHQADLLIVAALP